MHIKKPTSVKELCEFIWYLEEKYNLLNFEIQGVYPWQANRLEIYYELGRQIEIFEKTLEREISQSKKAFSLLKMIFNAVFNNTFKNLKKIDYLIFSHSRSKLLNGKPIDIYTHFLINNFKKTNASFIELEEHYKGTHIREKYSYTRYLDYITLMKNIKASFISIHLNSQQNEIMKNVQNEIKKYLGVEFELKNILVKRTKIFLIASGYFTKFLQKTKPKKIFLVISYGNNRPELIFAAKQLDIEIIELQHGTFSKYHLGYYFPNKQNLNYFPHIFYVWNDYWKSLIDFPIQNENIKIFPFIYMEKEKKKYANIKKIKNQAIVLCQAGLTDSIAKKILNHIDFFENYNLIFKLHPEEYGKTHMYKNLQSLKRKRKIKILENVDLYKLLADSEYQIGVFSTAIFEGLEFNCKTILVDLPGIEYMYDFIEYHSLHKTGCFYMHKT